MRWFSSKPNSAPKITTYVITPACEYRPPLQSSNRESKTSSVKHWLRRQFKSSPRDKALLKASLKSSPGQDYDLSDDAEVSSGDDDDEDDGDDYELDDPDPVDADSLSGKSIDDFEKMMRMGRRGLAREESSSRNTPTKISSLENARLEYHTPLRLTRASAGQSRRLPKPGIVPASVASSLRSSLRNSSRARSFQIEVNRDFGGDTSRRSADSDSFRPRSNNREFMSSRIPRTASLNPSRSAGSGESNGQADGDYPPSEYFGRTSTSRRTSHDRKQTRAQDTSVSTPSHGYTPRSGPSVSFSPDVSVGSARSRRPSRREMSKNTARREAREAKAAEAWQGDGEWA